MDKQLQNDASEPIYYDKAGIGRRIRRLRLENELTQAEFAESIDVSTNFISELENGHKGMSAETLCRLCTKYRKTSDYILFGTEVNALTADSIEEALHALPTRDLPAVIQYMQALYKIRLLDGHDLFHCQDGR